MAALLPRVKSRLFIHANRRSTNLLEGEYAAITAGRSLDFDDLREYVPGDEVDDIDWKATARTGNPLVKRYKQTRRQDVILAIDTGRGMAAASQGGSPKRDVAILIAGALGYLSLRHGDAVGLITRVRRPDAAPPAARQRGLPRDPAAHRRAGDPARRRPERPVRTLHATCCAASRTAASSSCRRRRRAVPDIDEALRALREKHELMWITVADLDLIDGDGTGRDILDVEDGSPIPTILRGDKKLAGDLRAPHHRPHRRPARLLPRARRLALPHHERRRRHARPAAPAAAPRGGY